MDNYSSLELLGKLKLYKTMKTKTIDRVIMDYWQSKVDISGSVMENSTCYDILWFEKTTYKYDFEEKKRFYKHRDLRTIRPHKLSFRVWFQSMSLRYNIEMAFFCICVLAFQYFVSAFNTDMHILNNDIEKLVEHNIIQITDEGRIINLERQRERSEREMLSQSDSERRFLQEE